MEQTTTQTLGHYTLNAYLGGTALASVYRATDQQRPREVAIKVLRSYFAREPDLTDRFLQEVERVRGLQHPHICRVYEVGRAGDLCYVAMEYTPWESLRERLQRPLSLGEALAIFGQVAQALEYALSQGVAHRNLKPSNIFVGPDNQVLVSDFGMAVLSEGVEAAMKIGAQTPMAAYRAPEETQGAPQDPYTDIYSLGVLAYELLTGALPFPSSSPPTVLVRQLTRTPTPPSQVNTTLPPEVDQAVLQALARRPEGRFTSVREFQDALEQALAPVAAEEAMAQPVAPAPPRETSGEGHQDALEQAVTREGLLQLCPLCGQVNDISATHCDSCWSRLVVAQVMEPQEAAQLLRKRRWQRRRQLLIRVGLAAIAPLALAGILINAIAGPAPPPPVTSPALNSDSHAGEWAMFRGDAARTGYASPTTVLPKGEVVWTFQTEPVQPLSEEDLALEEGERPNSPILASPAVVDGVVFLPTGDRRVVALEATTGKLVWEHTVSGPVNSSPAVAGDTVYVGLRDGSLLALDRATGHLRWTFPTGSPIFASPVVHQGTVYVTSTDEFLYAVDAATGDLRWKFQANGWIFSSPSVNHAVVTFATNEDRLYILDRETGAERMAFHLKGLSLSSPAFHSNSVIVGTVMGTVWAIDWRQEQSVWGERWYNLRLRMFILGIIDEIESRKGFVWLYKVPESGDSILSSSAVAQDRVFTCSAKGQCSALDADTGEVLWEHAIDAGVFSSPVVAGDVVYIGANDNKVYGFDVGSGEQVWEFTTGGRVTANPVVANGMLYVASQDGTLYAIQ